MTDSSLVKEGASSEVAILQARKRDLYVAIRTLARDREEGTIDEATYARARDRYEREAAGILERLDGLAGDGAAGRSGSRRSPVPAAFIALALVAIAVAIFLLAALRDRGSGTITGSLPAVGPTAAPVATAVPAPVVAARRQVRAHPESFPARLALGNAYLTAGNPAAADRAFRDAARLGPTRPEAPTLDALALTAEGKLTAALGLLAQVERSHATYARAWLTDGLIAARRAPGIPRAIRAWKRFLNLEPHSPVSGTVRASLARLEQLQRAGR